MTTPSPTAAVRALPEASPTPWKAAWRRSVAIVTGLVCSTLVASGYIGFRLASLHEESSRDGATLARLHADLASLLPRIGATAAAASQVSETGDPAGAASRLEAAVAAFNRDFERVSESLRGAAAAADAAALDQALRSAETSFRRLSVDARQVLSHVRLGESDNALPGMAAMNRHSHQLSLDLARAESTLRARQLAHDAANAATARALWVAEIAMLGIAALVAAVVLLCGRRMALALRQAHHQTEQLAARTRASDERFAFAARSTLDGIWDYDPVEGSSYHSERFLELLGLPLDGQFDLRRLDGLIHPDDLAAVEAARAAHGRDPAPVVLELRLRMPDGAYRWFLSRSQRRLDERGRLVGMTGSISDITERKTGELQLAESAARLAAERSRLAVFVEHAPAAIAMFDSSLRYVSASRRWMDTFLRGNRDVAGLPFYEVFGDIPRAWRTELSRVLEGGIVRVEDERWRPANGEAERHLRWEARPWLEQGSTQPGVLLFAQDITHDREHEAALERMRDAADAANRAKSEFLATMSHEIRTPMNGVLGFTQLLLDTALDAEQREFARTIDASGRSLLALLNDILDYSKIEAGKLRVELAPFDLPAVVDEVAALLATQCHEKRLELRVDYSLDAPRELVGDAARVRQVLTNLVGNAIKFTARGHVLIEVRRDGDDGVRVDVTDTGIGIAADLQPNLFAKFVQADSSTTRRFGGTGLGLAICKQLVELMDGAIGVRSAAGAGSTFWFRLPVPAGLADGERLPPADGARILLVEDHPVNRSLALRILGKLGYDADVAEDGATAVRMATACRYRLILMDCQLPQLSGFEATAAIRRHEAGVGAEPTPIIALTAGAMAQERERCFASGMQAFLTKPLVPADLRRVLEKWVPLGDAPRARESRATVAGPTSVAI